LANIVQIRRYGRNEILTPASVSSESFN